MSIKVASAAPNIGSKIFLMSLAGLVPAVRVLLYCVEDGVNPRDKPIHDELEGPCAKSHLCLLRSFFLAPLLSPTRRKRFGSTASSKPKAMQASSRWSTRVALRPSAD